MIFTQQFLHNFAHLAHSHARPWRPGRPVPAAAARGRAPQSNRTQAGRVCISPQWCIECDFSPVNYVATTLEKVSPQFYVYDPFAATRPAAPVRAVTEKSMIHLASVFPFLLQLHTGNQNISVISGSVFGWHGSFRHLSAARSRRLFRGIVCLVFL